jgi:hypothetical protein
MTKDTRPICPDCNEIMVKAIEQNEEGDWAYRWLCGCKITVRKAFCPECETEQDCRVMSSTSIIDELDCLMCGMDFEIDKFKHTSKEMVYFHELTG